MKKKAIYGLLCVMMLLQVLSISANADIGPKPSVRVSFEGIVDEICYGTLLSLYPSTGPASVSRS